MLLIAFLTLSSPLAPLADVRIGTEGAKVRIEVLCSKSCDVQPLDDASYLVTWAQADFVANVHEKTAFIEKIELSTKTYGTSLTVVPIFPPRAVYVVRCGNARLCFDYEFADAPGERHVPLTLASLDSELNELMSMTGYLERAKAPERQVTASIIGPTRTKPPKGGADISQPATGICGAAQVALERDAWNLAAYQTVTLCRARGENEFAASYLRQLKGYAEGLTSAAVASSALR